MASFALIYQVLGGLMALFFGSLTGVLIKRIPENKKLVLARSECPKCGHQLKWYENIPLLSFLILRAKCSNCKTKIPFFYPLIELGFLLCALLFINLAAKRLANFTGPFDQALIFIDLLFYFAFIAIALAAGLIDQGKKILPHKLSFAGILLGIMYVSLFASPYYEFSATLEELTSGILASTLSVIKQFAIVVFSLDLAVYFINKLVFRKDALLEVSNALCLGIGKLQEQKNLVYMLYSILVLILIYLN